MTPRASIAAEAFLLRQQATLHACDRLIAKLKERPDFSAVSLLIEQLRPLYGDYRRIRERTRSRSIL